MMKNAVDSTDQDMGMLSFKITPKKETKKPSKIEGMNLE